MKHTRNSWSYKIKMWYYRLTFEDVKRVLCTIGSFVFEFIIVVMGFLFIFIFPAFFH